MLLNEQEIEPACRTGEGCPIGEEIAADSYATEMASSYKMAKILHELNGVETMFIEHLKDMGIWEDKELLIDLENIYYEHRTKEKKREQREYDRRRS